MFPFRKRVEVSWVDANASIGWCSSRNASDLEPERVLSLGFLVTQTKQKITLALAQTESGGCNGLVTIPRQWVCSIRLLTHAGTKR